MIFELIKSFILGIVQGITEWLPVSSTGHMLLVDEFLKLDFPKDFTDMFFVVIQFGSILAVLVLYFDKLNPFSKHKNEKQKRQTWVLWEKVIIACIPAGVVGILFDDLIHDLLYGPIVIAIALIVYGILFIVLENSHPDSDDHFSGKAVVQESVLCRHVPDALSDSGHFSFRFDHSWRCLSRL